MDKTQRLLDLVFFEKNPIKWLKKMFQESTKKEV